MNGRYTLHVKVTMDRGDAQYMLKHATRIPPAPREDKQMAETLVGKIVKISEKGWGFLTTESMPFTRIFFHWSALGEGLNFLELRKGSKLEFILMKTEDRGYRAAKILRIVEDDIQREVSKGGKLGEEDKNNEAISSSNAPSAKKMAR